jgi:hypothetical protein
MPCVLGLMKFLIGILISAGVIHVAALATRVGDRGFGAAVSCAVALYVAGILLILPAGLFIGCFLPAWVAVIVMFLLIVYIIQSIYVISFGHALLMWFVMAVVNMLYLLLVYGANVLGILNLSGGGGCPRGI